MTNIKLVIEYDGTNYHGWQGQLNACTIQDTLASAIYHATGEQPVLSGSGRTDAGVHALAQTVSFQTKSSIPPEKFKYAINSRLPEDIRVLESKAVPDDFHARFNVTRKEYLYLIINSPDKSVFTRNRMYWVKGRLNVADMAHAARLFEGEHDFSSFCASGSSVKSTIRTVYKSCIQQEGAVISYMVLGNGFLYNMVRIIVGTLIDVGLGKIDKNAIPEILTAKSRKPAGKTAPAHGLYLKRVFYD